MSSRRGPRGCFEPIAPDMLSTIDKPSSDDLAITQHEIIRLKKRRDLLLNTACNRHERGKIFQEVKSINRRLQVLHERMTY